MKWLWFLSASSLFAQQITFTKSFPGSSPAYMQIRIDPSGATEYREDPADDNPFKFDLPSTDRDTIVALVKKLDNFQRPLESPAKVANMGMKTFEYQNGTDRHEVKFNYSEDPDARLLADWFERIAETEQERIDLERAAKFDKLGVDKALLRIAATWDRKRLVSPEQMLPMLDRIRKNDSYMHMSRTKASEIAEQIRAPK